VQAKHITELQNAVSTMFTTTQTFTAASSSTEVRAMQLQELQDKIDTARAAFGLPPNSRHDASYDNTVSIKAPNVQELRDALK
jgi:3'-phosphoadenosine 5'-phosphosulfate sulfotransferase